jgi:Fungal specific transcription factor domain
MNQEITYANKNAKTCRLWRRIWWTCVSRDRLTSITTRKPIQIQDEEINLPALKFKDFDTLPYKTNIRLLQESSLIVDFVGKVMLADMFMSKIHILLIIGRIIRHLYFLQGFAGSTSDWTMFYIPRKTRDLSADCICRLQDELSNWSSTLNTYCQMDYHDDGLDEIQARIMRVHRAVLQLLQAMAQEALHRPQVFLRPESSALSNTDTPTNKSWASTRQAASAISDTLQTLREEDLLKYLPPLSVGCTIAAAAWFLVEIKLEKTSPAELPGYQFHQCFRSLMKLREIWPIAEGACSMVSQMIANNQIVFAWNFRMLSKPIGSNETSEYEQQGTENQQKEPRAQVESTNADLDIAYDGPHVDVNSIPSTYRALMYPFSWTASEFDFYNELDPSYCPLFTEHVMEECDISSTLNSGMSGYLSSVEQMA